MHSFLEFVTKAPPAGLDTTVKWLYRLCDDDEEALRLLQLMTAQPEGGDGSNQYTDATPNNISGCTHEDRQHGTGRAYTLVRLAEQRPDLYARVVADELSANAAAIEAGWRPPTLSVRLDHMGLCAAAALLRRRLSPTDLAALMAAA